MNTNEIFNNIKAYTVPIYKIDNNIEPVCPKPLGSGVLVECEGNGFLFSAGHVFTDERIDRLGVNTVEGFYVLCGHVTFMRTSGNIENPNNIADVAVYFLDNQFTNDIRRFYSFLPISQVVIDKVIPFLSDYYVFGYPASRFRINPKTHTVVRREFGFVTRLEKDFRKWHRLHKLPKTNYIIKFSRRNIVRESDKRHVWAPKLYGISGCGLWIVQEERLLLLGIMNEFSNKEAVMVGTRTDYYTEIMRRNGCETIRRSPLRIRFMQN